MKRLCDLRSQDGNCCPQMRPGVVKKLNHQLVAFEDLLDDATLHALSAPVNEPDFAQAGCMCRVDVLFDNGGDVAGPKRMQVEHAFDGNPQRVLILHGSVGRGLFVAGRHFGFDAAPNGEIADDRHPPRLARGDKIVEDLVRDVFVENTPVAVLD